MIEVVAGKLLYHFPPTATATLFPPGTSDRSFEVVDDAVTAEP